MTIKYLPQLSLTIEAVEVSNLPESLGPQTAAESLSVVLASDGTLPLPAGAATSAKQDTQTAHLAAIETAIEGTLSVDTGLTGLATETTAAAILADTADIEVAVESLDTKAVQMALDFGASSGAVRTAAVLGNASGALAYDSGASSAATLRTVLATRHETATTPLATRLTNGTSFISVPLATQLPASLGIKTAAASLSIAFASDIATLPVSLASVPASPPYGYTVRNTYRLDYSSINVDTTNWHETISNLSGDVKRVHIFDSSGNAFEIGTGGSGSETQLFVGGPGGIDIDVAIVSGTRMSIRMLSGDATSGELVMNFLG